MLLPIQIFFLRSSRIRVDQPTDKQEQYDSKTEKKLDGYYVVRTIPHVLVGPYMNDDLLVTEAKESEEE